MNSSSKKILTDIGKSLKDVFKNYSKYSRQRGWNTITGKEGEIQVKKIILDPNNYPISNFEKLNFKEWLNQSEPKI
jgi:hypothetical protein